MSTNLLDFDYLAEDIPSEPVAALQYALDMRNSLTARLMLAEANPGERDVLSYARTAYRQFVDVAGSNSATYAASLRVFNTSRSALREALLTAQALAEHVLAGVDIEADL